MIALELTLPPSSGAHNPRIIAGLAHELNEKQTRAKHTLEFKQEAVRQIRARRATSAVAATLGIPKASLTNWSGPMRGAKGGGARKQSSAAGRHALSSGAREVKGAGAATDDGARHRKKALAYFAQDVPQGTLGFNR